MVIEGDPRKHSAAMLSYWRRMRRAAERLGLTVREARGLYRKIAAEARRDGRAVTCAFGRV